MISENTMFLKLCRALINSNSLHAKQEKARPFLTMPLEIRRVVNITNFELILEIKIHSKFTCSEQPNDHFGLSASTTN